MNLHEMIAQLRTEQAAVDEAIAILEHIAGTQAGASLGRRSLETRKKMAAAQRKRWAAVRRGKKTRSRL